MIFHYDYSVAVHRWKAKRELVHGVFVGREPFGKRGGRSGSVVNAVKWYRTTSGFRGVPKYYDCAVEVMREIIASLSPWKSITLSDSVIAQAGWTLARAKERS